MLATEEAYNLLNQAGFEQLDGVYTNNLPEEIQDATDRSDALITEVNSYPDEYGNNIFVSFDNVIEVQIFYDLNPNFDLEVFELELMRLFQKNYWRIEQTKPHVEDPETQQVTKVFYFAKTKYLN